MLAGCRLNAQLVIAGVIAISSAATGFAGAWKIQSWRADAREKEYAEQALENERLVAKTITRQQTAVIAATDAGTARSIALRRDADAGRAALLGLHDATAAALRTAESSQAACLDRAATLAELLDTMASAGGELAAKAGRHASDVQTLTDGWPK